MKKIFETILILALCLGLASCGLLPSSNSEENQTVEENKNNSSTDSFEDEKGNDPYPARTTVTIDEWLLAMSISNYSFSLVGYETNDEGVLEQNNVSYAYCTPDKMFAYGVYEGEAYEEYTARIDGLDYNIYKTDSGYVAEEIVTYIMDTHIGEFIADEDEWKEIFERLSYDESTDTYTEATGETFNTSKVYHIKGYYIKEI